MMIEDFMIRASISGIGVAMAAGPLGSLVVWQRMSFFGDALAHSALLGIAISFFLQVNHIIGIIVFASLFSVVIVNLQRQRSFSSDTILAILAHSSLAIGMVVVSLNDSLSVNLETLFFGDILSSTSDDILYIYAGGAVSLVTLAYIWRPLLLSILNADLARVEGVNINLVQILFLLLISLLVALSIKVVGVLLVTSLLIIPAATARIFANTPEKMAVIASMLGASAVVLGLIISLKVNIPSGPSIVISLLIFFCAIQLFYRIKKKP